jgi:hypothetical protein
MPEKYIKVVSPSGTVLSVTEEEARDLAVLDYRAAPTELLAQRAAVASEESYYGGVGDKAEAFLEGGLSGLSFGGYDLLQRAIGDDERLERTRKLAQHNPGWRMAGTLAGGLALGGAKTVAGAIAEGAAFGAGAGLSETMLSEDPVSVEALVANMGHGALLGGAVGGVAQGVGAALVRRGAAGQASKVAEADALLAQRGAQDAYRAFREGAASAVDDALKPRAPPQRMPPLDGQAIKQLQQELARATDEASGALALAGNKGAVRDLRTSWARVRKADTLAEFETHAATMKALGFEPPASLGALRKAADDAEAAFSEASQAFKFATTDAKGVQEAITHLPTKLSGLGSMPPEQAIKVAEAMLKAPRVAEQFAPVIESMGLTKVLGEHGLPAAWQKYAGTPAEPFLLAREAAASLRSSAAAAPIAGAADDAVDFVDEGKKLITRGAVRAGLGLGIGPGMLAWPAAGVLIRLMHGAKAGVGDHLSAWATRGGKALKGGSSFFANAASHGDSLHEEFEREAQPLRDRTGSTRDRAYMATDPLRMTGQMKLADRMFEQLVRTDEHLAATMPTLAPGPGVMGKQIQRQTREEMQAWLGRVAVVKDPQGAFANLGQLSPEQTQTLRVAFPGLVEEAKLWVADRLPQLQESLSHKQMMALSELFDAPLVDSLTESYLQMSQQGSLTEPAPSGTTPGDSLMTPAPPEMGSGMTPASGSGGGGAGGAMQTQADSLNSM